LSPCLGHDVLRRTFARVTTAYFPASTLLATMPAGIADATLTFAPMKKV